MPTEAFPNTNTAVSLASIGYGAAFSIGVGTTPATATWTLILECTDADWTGLTVGAEEVTNLGSPNAAREYTPGLLDGGKISVEGNLIGDTTQQSLMASIEARTIQYFQIQALINAKSKVYTIQVTGFLTKFAPTGKVEPGKAVKFAAEVQVTGMPVVTLV
jgi:hypothetical protein